MTPIVLALALTLAAADNPADLAAKVASGDLATRREAEGRLEEIGREALPALRIARGGASDTDAVRRLGDLIELIERRRLLRASAVELVEKDVPAVEAVADLARRSGFRLMLEPPGDPAWAARRVSIASSGPVGFWEALDRLGAAGGFRLDAPAAWPGAPRDSPAVRLVPADGPASRTAHAGPYRVDLMALERRRRASPARPGREPRRVDEFTLVLRLVAEPGIVVDRNGLPRIVEAVDDREDDLRPESTADPSSRPPPPHRQWRPELARLEYRIPLKPPAGLGGSIRRLRGVLPITALARTGPLMSAPLAGSEGRPFAAGGVTLIVRRLDRSQVDGRVSALHVVVQGDDARLTPGSATGPRGLQIGPLHPAYLPEDHIQILDDRGRPLRLWSTPTPRRPDGVHEYSLTVYPDPGLGPPATIRYHGLVGEATEIPFSFADVPMP